MIRFLFGTGWWVVWYVAVYLILLVGVGVTLLAFGAELKKPGQQPDMPTLGSMLFVMIPLSIGVVTLVNLLLASPVMAHGILLRITLALTGTAAAMLLTGMAAWWLATAQSHASFGVNVALAVIASFANLTLLHLARRPVENKSFFGQQLDLMRAEIHPPCQCCIMPEALTAFVDRLCLC